MFAAYSSHCPPRSPSLSLRPVRLFALVVLKAARRIEAPSMRLERPLLQKSNAPMWNNTAGALPLKVQRRASQATGNPSPNAPNLLESIRRAVNPSFESSLATKSTSPTAKPLLDNLLVNCKVGVIRNQAPVSHGIPYCVAAPWRRSLESAWQTA